ncbi:MAG: hypothetical protein K6G15_11235 [Desulfovibrio sp.]|nr:hypothetical protein [Desulfovibrio sp.]
MTQTTQEPLTTVLAQRPLNVLQACILQVFTALLTAATTMHGYDHYVELGRLLHQQTGSFEQFIASRAISVLVALLLAWLFYQGRNWARLFFVAFFVINFACIVWSLSSAGQALLSHLGDMDSLISLLQLVISLVVCVLLMTRKSAAWFQAVKRARTQEKA